MQGLRDFPIQNQKLTSEPKLYVRIFPMDDNRNITFGTMKIHTYKFPMEHYYKHGNGVDLLAI
jgi:hypothetical protein